MATMTVKFHINDGALDCNTQDANGKQLQYHVWKESDGTLHLFRVRSTTSLIQEAGTKSISGSSAPYTVNSSSSWSDYTRTRDVNSSGSNSKSVYFDFTNISTFGAVGTGCSITSQQEYAMTSSGGTPLNQDPSSSTDTNAPTVYKLNGNANLTSNKTVIVYMNWQTKSDRWMVYADANGGTFDTSIGWKSASSYMIRYYASGDKYYYFPTLNDRSGYVFKGWFTDSINGTQLLPSQTVNSSYRVIYAHWQAPAVYYTISTSADPSAGGGTSGGGSYESGTSCTVSCLPNLGYSFTGWYEGSSRVSTSQSYNFTVTKARTLVAKFSPSSYTISVSSNNTLYGTVSGGGSYTYNSSCTIIATVTDSSLYQFDGWYKDNSTYVSGNATYTFTVGTGNASYTARFSYDPTYTLRVRYHMNGGHVEITDDNKNNNNSTLGSRIRYHKDSNNIEHYFTYNADCDYVYDCDDINRTNAHIFEQVVQCKPSESSSKVVNFYNITTLGLVRGDATTDSINQYCSTATGGTALNKDTATVYDICGGNISGNTTVTIYANWSTKSTYYMNILYDLNGGTISGVKSHTNSNNVTSYYRVFGNDGLVYHCISNGTGAAPHVTLFEFSNRSEYKNLLNVSTYSGTNGNASYKSGAEYKTSGGTLINQETTSSSSTNPATVTRMVNSSFTRGTITLYVNWQGGGTVYVKTNDGWVQGIVYIKTDSGWQQGIPYVKTGSSTWSQGV